MQDSSVVVDSTPGFHTVRVQNQDRVLSNRIQDQGRVLGIRVRVQDQVQASESKSESSNLFFVTNLIPTHDQNYELFYFNNIGNICRSQDGLIPSTRSRNRIQNRLIDIWVQDQDRDQVKSVDRSRNQDRSRDFQHCKMDETPRSDNITCWWPVQCSLRSLAKTSQQLLYYIT